MSKMLLVHFIIKDLEKGTLVDVCPLLPWGPQETDDIDLVTEMFEIHVIQLEFLDIEYDFKINILLKPNINRCLIWWLMKSLSTAKQSSLSPS